MGNGISHALIRITRITYDSTRAPKKLSFGSSPTVDLDALLQLLGARLLLLAVLDVVVDGRPEHQVGYVEDEQQDPSVWRHARRGVALPARTDS